MTEPENATSTSIREESIEIKQEYLEDSPQKSTINEIQVVDKERRRNFPLDFKLQVVEEAKLSNNQTIALKYEVDEKLIRDWKRNEEKIRRTLQNPDAKNKFICNGGGRPKQVKTEEVQVVDTNDVENPNPSERRRNFPLDFKIQVVEEAKLSNNRTVGLKYEINEKQIGDWRRNEDKIRATLQNPGAKNKFICDGGGRRKQVKTGDDYPRLEEMGEQMHTHFLSPSYQDQVCILSYLCPFFYLPPKKDIKYLV